jgi:hypothetical protein
MEAPNTASLANHLTYIGVDRVGIRQAFRNFNAAARAFQRESDLHA